MPTLYTRMSQNRDMGHPFICGWSDVGHPPGLDLYGTMYIHGVRDSLSFAVTIFVSLIMTSARERASPTSAVWMASVLLSMGICRSLHYKSANSMWAGICRPR